MLDVDLLLLQLSLPPLCCLVITERESSISLITGTLHLPPLVMHRRLLPRHTSPLLATMLQCRIGLRGALHRHLSSVAAKHSSEPKSETSSSGHNGPSGTTNEVGQFFQNLVFRGRQGRLLAVGDLRKLLELCKTRDHVKYAVLGVELYQRKRHDFSEEVNSHFVSACIRGGEPMAAVELFLRPSHRIGAWSTLTSMQRLIDALGEEADGAKLKDMFFLLANKGVRFSEDVIVKIFTAASKAEGFELTDDLLSAAQHSVYPRDEASIIRRLKDIPSRKAEA